ncbi:hypothetical protein Rt10032_c08g3681 [Rhodotorula toruloides]|uniref:Uncharacterized protein n=1 Tax=Rhodotorula toruloides TaxID=5286 RepID=A0A511KJM3_RHOTO|nr:hypothetical protein Rt10032_c08g3681 [Rhodotorula toruloides]
MSTSLSNLDNANSITPAQLLERLQRLNEENLQLAQRQAALRGEYFEFVDQVAQALQADPTLLPRLHAEMMASTPSAPLDFTMSPDLICGNVDEGLPKIELSPPFGPTPLEADAASFSAFEDIPLASLPPSLLKGDPEQSTLGSFHAAHSSTASPTASVSQSWGSIAPPSLWSSSPSSTGYSPLFEDFTNFGAWGTPQTESNRSFSTSTSFILAEPFSGLLNSPLADLVDASFGKAKNPSPAQQDPSVASSLLASPQLRPFGQRTGSTKRGRTTRTLEANDSRPVVKNAEHVFAVLSLPLAKGEESHVTRLYLDEATMLPMSPIARAILRGERYSFRQDCELCSVYTFYSACGAAWTLAFTPAGPNIFPASPVKNPASQPTHTFLHFLPVDIVVSPSHPIGSVDWWRVQECRNSHAGYPGSGGWTARYDGETEGEKRRPARIYAHFAKCAAKGCEDGGEWSLMKLAKAMKPSRT